jgi:hypothetical protein
MKRLKGLPSPKRLIIIYHPNYNPVYIRNYKIFETLVRVSFLCLSISLPHRHSKDVH